MWRECEGGCSRGTVFSHDSLVVGHEDGIMLLDAVNEDLANPLQLVLHRQAKDGRKSWVLDILLEKERSGFQVCV